jgi:putative membrane protein
LPLSRRYHARRRPDRQLLEWEIGSGQDARVRAYAVQMLPIVLEHLEHAQGLQAELTGSATRL